MHLHLRANPTRKPGLDLLSGIPSIQQEKGRIVRAVPNRAAHGLVHSAHAHIDVHIPSILTCKCQAFGQFPAFRMRKWQTNHDDAPREIVLEVDAFRELGTYDGEQHGAFR